MTTKKSNLKDLSEVKKELKVEVPISIVNIARTKAIAEVQKKAKMPGFREGKVPTNIVEKHFTSEIEKQTVDELIHLSLGNALNEADLRPISRPQFTQGMWNLDGGYHYHVTFEVIPNIPIKEKDYKGLKLEKSEAFVSKEEVDAELKRLQQVLTQLEPVSEGTELAEGYVAMIDYIGTADGSSFKGGEAKDFPVDFGAGGLLVDFEKGLKGTKEGEKRVVEFVYPSDYFNKDLAGKKAHFDISIKSIRKKNVPLLNDDFAKDLGNYKTLDEVKKDIEKRILQSKEEQQKNIFFGQILQKLIEGIQFEIPQSLVNEELSYMLEVFARDLEKKGQNIKDLDLKELVSKMQPEASNRVQGFLILDKIAQEEKLEVTEKEIEDQIANIAQTTRRSLEEVKTHYQKNELMNSLRFQILNEKTLEFVLNEANIKDVKPEKKKK